MILAFVVAAIFFWLAFDGGSYALESRATLAIALWWTTLVAVVLGLWPLARPPRTALLAGALLAAFTLLTGASMLWGESAERAFTEFNRSALYLGVFLLAVLVGTRGNLGRWLDGLTLALVATGLLALATRFFPDVLPAGQVPEFLPTAAQRLSYPVEYWNGLAILLGIAFPLLLRVASGPGRAVWRGLAVAPFPALVASMYLTSSRGGFATAVAGTAVFLVATARRWSAVAALMVAGVASAVSIAVLLARDELVNDPFGSPLAVEQGRSAAVAIAAVCAIAGLLYGLGARFLGGHIRIPEFVGRLAAILALLVLTIGIVAWSPVDRFEAFKQPPAADVEDDFIRAHLLSGSGSGRWQFWSAAYDQFQAAPVLGQGAGSYEAWWAEHGSITLFARDAHSLYLETLGELGIVGLVLLVGAFGVGLVAGATRVLRAQGEERVAVAALLGAFSAYLVAAGIDWMWELTIVTVVGIALLGFLTGPATALGARPRLAEPGSSRWSSRGRFAIGVAAVAVGWLVVCAQAIPFLGDIKLSDSQTAIAEGDVERALEDAVAARNLQPWAASPYLQIALVHEESGELDGGRDAIRAAIERDPRNWQLWLVRARLETQAGAIEDARRSLRRAADLNPRSPLFASVS